MSNYDVTEHFILGSEIYQFRKIIIYNEYSTQVN